MLHVAGPRSFLLRSVQAVTNAPKHAHCACRRAAADQTHRGGYMNGRQRGWTESIHSSVRQPIHLPMHAASQPPSIDSSASIRIHGHPFFRIHPCAPTRSPFIHPSSGCSLLTVCAVCRHCVQLAYIVDALECVYLGDTACVRVACRHCVRIVGTVQL